MGPSRRIQLLLPSYVFAIERIIPDTAYQAMSCKVPESNAGYAATLVASGTPHPSVFGTTCRRVKMLGLRLAIKFARSLRNRGGSRLTLMLQYKFVMGEPRLM